MTRLTVVGNLIYYIGDVIIPTSDLTTMKLHENSIIYDIQLGCVRMDSK